jgi:hypothetical protein
MLLESQVFRLDGLAVKLIGLFCNCPLCDVSGYIMFSGGFFVRLHTARPQPMEQAINKRAHA